MRHNYSYFHERRHQPVINKYLNGTSLVTVRQICSERMNIRLIDIPDSLTTRGGVGLQEAYIAIVIRQCSGTMFQLPFVPWNNMI